MTICTNSPCPISLSPCALNLVHVCDFFYPQSHNIHLLYCFMQLKKKKKIHNINNKFLLNLEGRERYICNCEHLYSSFPRKHIMLHTRMKAMDRTNKLGSATSSFFPLLSQSEAHPLFNLTTGEEISYESRRFC